ncbi:MAG TPA: choice-of-anchor tandem repeat GloVer-containing protein [Rhizomicrobium sp.]|jgi:uncharacterized repeat protein (TIGR03803 family)
MLQQTVAKKAGLHCLLVLLVSLPLHDGNAKQFTSLYSFEGGKKDGARPSGVITDQSGNFYGTTSEGGPQGYEGIVFELSQSGIETVLHRFNIATDGAAPAFGVIRDADGNLYGTTELGDGDGCYTNGCGTVFSLKPDGTYTVLYDFQGGKDGGIPSGVIADSSGNLYGTTQQGGTGCPNVGGCGTVFEISSSGTESVLYTFIGGNDGAIPYAGLVEDAQGNFYGTTLEGGSSNCDGQGCGTVFKLAADGKETTLYAFTDGNDGGYPEESLILDKDGNLYGTTSGGGDANCAQGEGGCGVIFKITPSGTESVLYTFTGGSDGAEPFSPLIMDGKGDLFGTTEGGTGIDGTVFKLAPNGVETVLYTFKNIKKDGLSPFGQLAQFKGHFVGTTLGGGRRRNGTVYSLKQ